jgi:hypothetical protein
LADDSEPPPIAPFAKAFFRGLASAIYNFLEKEQIGFPSETKGCKIMKKIWDKRAKCILPASSYSTRKFSTWSTNQISSALLQ